MESFVISIKGEDINDPEKMEEFQKIMDEYHDLMVEQMKSLAKELNVSESCASDVFYLRTRSRWTQELENELIRLHSESNPPNIYDFGC